MTLLLSLTFLNLCATLLAGVVSLTFLVPAWKRTRHQGFLFWGASNLGVIWNTITLGTIGSKRSHPEVYTFFRYSHQIIFLLNLTLALIGTVMIIKSYGALFAEARGKREAGLAASPPPPGEPA